MKELTLEQKLENTLLACAGWSLVKPEAVVERLSYWRCGTHACFGGHLIKMEGFKHLFDQRFEAPALLEERGLWADSIAEHLFGNDELFFARTCRDPASLTDHEVVTYRLNANAERLRGLIEERK